MTAHVDAAIGFQPRDGLPAQTEGRPRVAARRSRHQAALHRALAALTLRWRDDLAQLMQREAESVNWGLLLAEARWRALVLALQRNLPAVGQEWALPAPVLEALAEMAPRRAEKAAMACYTGPLRGTWRHGLLDVARLPSWRLRVRLVRRAILPSQGYMTARYGEVAAWCRHPYRWWLGLRTLTGGRSA